MIGPTRQALYRKSLVSSRRIVRAARSLLARKGWTKGAFARDADGHKVDFKSPEAAQYCIAGAVRGCLRVNDRLPELPPWLKCGYCERECLTTLITANDDLDTQEEADALLAGWEHWLLSELQESLFATV